VTKSFTQLNLFKKEADAIFAFSMHGQHNGRDKKSLDSSAVGALLMNVAFSST
jgi:hypothetical protein